MLKNNKILKNIKVLELEGLAPSLFTGMMLADFGADVLMIQDKTPKPGVSIPLSL